MLLQYVHCFSLFIFSLAIQILTRFLQGKKFWSKITIDSLQANKGWWVLSCDDCNWRAVEEGSEYWCTREKRGGKSASLRLQSITYFNYILLF